MTAHLAFVMGVCLLSGDPMYPSGPAPQYNVAPVSYNDGSGGPMLAQAPPIPAGAPAPAPGAGDPAMAPSEYPAINPAPASPGDDVHYFSLDELRAEMKKLAWTKGDFSIVPYGILWANWVEETGRTTPGNYPLYVARPRVDANDDCYVDARSTRLGFDVLGPQIPTIFGCAQTGGKVEIDFQRQIDVENKASLLLRHAYIEVKNDEFRLLLGQTWDVISPLTPGVLFYSVGWDGGNIGYRRPQFRLERYLAISDEFEFIAQGSVDTIAPSDTTGTATTYNALPSGWPIVEGRMAMLLGPRGQGCLPWEFGVSSHIGEFTYDLFKGADFDFNNEIGVPRRTWSLNTDMRIPITPYFGVQGELFVGEGLGPFFGGIGQTVDFTPYTDSHGVIHYASGDDIRSRGGWVDLWYDWTPRLHSHTGYSIDNPFYQDVTSGRVYNAFYFANVSFDVTSKFLVGFEYTYWKTLWVGPSADAISHNFNLVAKYGF